MTIALAYDRRGEGAPLLLLPGFTMRRQMWPEELCEALARSHTVVRVDNRDAGASPRIEARPPRVLRALGRALLGLPIDVPYTLEDMAEDTLAVADRLGFERFHLAGASMGGMIAQVLALRAPERVLSLTSVMSSPGGRRYAIGTPRALKALLTPAPASRAAYVETLVGTLRLLHGPVLPFDEAEAREIAEAQADLASPPAAARQLGAIFEGASRRLARIGTLRVPTLVIHGTADPLLPLRGARAMARRVPGAKLLEVPGMGHGFPAAARATIAAAIARHTGVAT